MSIGEYLKKIREEKKVSLEEVARETSIRIAYLQAIEGDQLEALPSRSQAKGFTRLYAAYLGLNARDIFDEVEKAEKAQPEANPAETEVIPVPAPVLVEKPRTLPSLTKKKAKKPAASKPVEELPVEIPVDLPVSQVIFNEIGRELKSQREALGLSLSDVERLTRIREYFIYTLETGQVDDLPSTVQGRGMLNAYAEFLNLNADSLQLRYADGLQQRRQEKYKVEEASRKGGIAVMGKAPLSGWRRFLTPDLLIGGTVFIALFALVIWGASQMIKTSLPQEEPTLASISDVLVGGLSDTPEVGEISGGIYTEEAFTTQVPATPQVDLQATLAAGATGPIQVVVVAYQRAYMRIIVDGQEEFAGRVVPGNVYNYSGFTKISLLTGNAAALQIYYNQQDLGVLGDEGKLLELDFTREQMSTAVPLFSPTPSLTPKPTLTALPTSTPRPSPTVPTATITPARTP